MQSRFVTIDGARTHYFTGGEGTPIVLLHGGDFGGRAENSWGFNMEVLARRHRVIAPDWLGFGQTDKIYDFARGRQRVIDHMANFLAALEIADAHFVANSMGATNLIKVVAARDPRFRPRSMVIASGGGLVPDNDARRALLEFDCTRESMVRMLKALFTDERWWRDEAYVEQRLAWACEPGVWETASAPRIKAPHLPPRTSYGQPDDTPYENIDCPTLLIAGADDQLRHPGYAADLAKRIEGSELIVYDGVGHCPNIECADAFNSAVLDFTGRVDSRVPG